MEISNPTILQTEDKKGWYIGRVISLGGVSLPFEKISGIFPDRNEAELLLGAYQNGRNTNR